LNIKQIKEIIPGYQTKYIKWYFSIIQKAKRSKRKKDGKHYYEEHHILPKGIWPKFKNEEWNKVILTAREHYLVHKLLLKHFEKLCWTIQKPIYSMNSKNSREYLKRQIRRNIDIGTLDIDKFEYMCRNYTLAELCFYYNTSKRQIKSTAKYLQLKVKND